MLYGNYLVKTIPSFDKNLFKKYPACNEGIVSESAEAKNEVTIFDFSCLKMFWKILWVDLGPNDDFVWMTPQDMFLRMVTC